MKVLPANRVAALTAFLTGLAGCATSAAGMWPSATTQNIAVVGGFVLASAGPLAHIIGSWLWDRTPAGQALGTGFTPLKTELAPHEIQAGLAPSGPEEAPDDWDSGEESA